MPDIYYTRARVRKAYIISAIAVIVVLVVLSLTLLALVPKEASTVVPLDDPTLPSRGFFMGVLPTPHEGQSFEEAYEQASDDVEFAPVWGKPSPFYDMADDLGGSWGDTFVGDYIRGTGMFPLIHFSFFSTGMSLAKPTGMDGATLSDPAWREAYTQAVVDTVREVRPLYLSIGNEVNRWYEEYGAEADDPNGFQHFVSLYEETYDAVKEVSNETMVFCVFSREIVSEYREADLDVLDMFDQAKMDLLAFTSYPFAVQGVNLPADLEDDYYSRALSHMPGKMVGFSELGWPSIEAFGGEQGQADFLSDMVGRLTVDAGMDLHMLAWAWLHDIDADDETGLLECDGTAKLAYQVWIDISES
jgi:hypothetical protein